MKLTPIAVALCAALSLTACGERPAGLGLSGSTGESRDVEAKSMIDRVKEMSDGNSSKANLSMPGIVITNEAFRAILQVAGYDADSLQQTYFYAGGANKGVYVNTLPLLMARYQPSLKAYMQKVEAELSDPKRVTEQILVLFEKHGATNIRETQAKSSKLTPAQAKLQPAVTAELKANILAEMDAKKAAYDPAKLTAEAIAAERLRLAELKPAADTVQALAKQALLKCFDAYDKDQAKGLACIEDFHFRTLTVGAVLAAHTSHRGTRIAEHNDGYSHARSFNQAELYTLVYGIANTGRFASALESELATAFGNGRVMRDPAAAQLAVARLVFEMPRAYFEALDENTRLPDTIAQPRVSPGQLSSDLEFTLSETGETYKLSEKGVTIVRDSIPWFGDSIANGTKYELALERSFAVNMSKRSSNSSSDGSRLSDNVQSTANIGK